MSLLPPDHFLSLPRPDISFEFHPGFVDTSTLAAHDFDVDTRTGFMPPQPPLARLPNQWQPWETMLDDAVHLRLQLGDKPGLPEDEAEKSASWRARVREMSILPTNDLARSETLLRRAHHVLAWTMHFYIHTLPPTSPVHIPPPITVPHLQICNHLRLPPVLTYSDNVLYNWALKVPSKSSTDLPTVDNLRSQTLFTGTTDEEEFYLSSARIELRGVEALELMRATMDEAFVGDDIAIRRITEYLRVLARVINDLRELLLSVRNGCDPEVFYRDIRPWFRGVDSDKTKRRWVFEGLDMDPALVEPTELSGPSAGQSSLIHALDVFLGVDKYSHSSELTGHSDSPSTSSSSSPSTRTSVPSFLSRMQAYMPRHHRAFLTHLSANPRPLRAFVFSPYPSTSSSISPPSPDPDLLATYNVAVQALKEFRDAHIRIVALYIVGPARRDGVGKPREKEAIPAEADHTPRELLKGTGGTDLVNFLKEVRDRTAGALITSTEVKEGSIQE